MKLFYRTYGEGKPLVILHGLYGISDNWVTHARALSEKYQVIIPDLRNHGQSPHSSVFNYNAMTEDVRELLEDLEIESCLLIGHSMGGKLAMNLALENSEVVEKLIVVDMSPKRYYLREFHNKLMDAMMHLDFTQLKSRKEVEDALKMPIPDDRIRQFIMKNLHWTETKSLSWRMNLPSILENIDYVFDAIEGHTTSMNPALFISGGKSDYVTDADFPLIFQKFPFAEIKTIPQAGHWVQADQPDDFLMLVNDFLGD